MENKKEHITTTTLIISKIIEISLSTFDRIVIETKLFALEKCS